MRPLRPAALPSDTSVRFVLLLAAVTTATLYLFQALWFLVRGARFVDVVRECGLTSAELTPTTVGGFGTMLQAQEACRSGISREQAIAAVGGATVVLVAAWGLYRVLPAWRERRSHLSPPDPDDGDTLVAAVDRLAADAGVQPAPVVRLDAADPAITGVAYGNGSAMRLGISGGLVVAQVTQPETFEAVVRHELGHVANRDVRWTYYSVATWWSFVALALVPVVLAFTIRDIQYVLRLGWRSVFLAALVATTLAALLRTRELYADARAADWGSAPALDQVLAGRALASTQRGRRWRPRVLRLHPAPEARRLTLHDPDRLFVSSGWVALAAALACGTAVASISDITYLVAPRAAVALSALLVAPLLAVALCVPAWRVALRGAVRGTQPAGVAALGLGAGVGLAAAPQLTIAAAMGDSIMSPDGWAGYALWALGMVVLGLVVAWWTCGTARLAVPAALSLPRGPRRALLLHVTVVSLVVALWISAGAQARLLLTNLGPRETWALAPWDVLPSLSFGFRLAYLPLLLAALLLALPTWAWLRLRHDRPVAEWPWRDGGPTRRGDLPLQVDAVGTRPPMRVSLLVAAGAGIVAGSVTLAVLLAGEFVAPEFRTSDAFALALGYAIEWAILAAGLVAGAVAVFVLPRIWWPQGLLASAAGIAIAAAGGWVLLTANRFGLLQHSGAVHTQLGFDASLWLLVRPAARAVVPGVLVVAAAGAVRNLLGRSDRGSVSAPTTGRSWLVRGLAGAGVAALACGLLIAPKVMAVLTQQPAQVHTASATLTVPALWTANVDPTSGQIVVDSIDGEVRVVLMPIEAPSPPLGAGAIVVGGVSLPEIGELDQGPERWWVYEGRTSSGAQRVIVIGQPRRVTERESEILQLLAGVRWRGSSGG